MKILKNNYSRFTLLIFNIFSINIGCGHKMSTIMSTIMPKNALVDICGQNCGQVDIIVDNCGHKMSTIMSTIDHCGHTIFCSFVQFNL